MRRFHVKTLVALGLVVTVLSLVLAGAAGAWRVPTLSERQAITRVSKGTGHAGAGKVHVSLIHVSTVGPWASAVIAVYFNGEPDDAIDVLHKVHGTWLLTKHSPGTFGEQCGIGMPRRDQRNLDFSGCSGGM